MKMKKGFVLTITTIMILSSFFAVNLTTMNTNAITITGDVLWIDQTYYLNEPLYVEGNLTIDNCTLVCNSLTDGDVFIQVNNTGNFYVYNNSTITWNNTGRYYIRVYGHVQIVNSTIEYAGYTPGPQYGFWIRSNDNLIRGSEIRNSGYTALYIPPYNNLRNITIEDCQIYDNYEGVAINGVNSINIFDNVFWDNGAHTIEIRYTSSEIFVIGNTISNSGYSAIKVDDSVNVSIIGNIAIDGAKAADGAGIELSCDNVIISDNYVSYSDKTLPMRRGIRTGGMDNVIIKNNTMYNCSIDINGGSLENWNTHTIDTNNTVNGKPVYYMKNQSNGIIPAGAGEVILANCTNITVENQDVSDGSVGIQLAFSPYCIIRNNKANYNCVVGIGVLNSECTDIYGNEVNYCFRRGISGSGKYSEIHNNTVSNSGIYGIETGTHFNISNNLIHDNLYGILVDDYSNIQNNSIFENSYGIHLSYKRRCTIYGNSISNHSMRGIYLYRCSDFLVSNNILAKNLINLNVQYSLSNSFINNNLSSSSMRGINLRSSNYNMIYHNNFINNSIQAYEYEFNNGYGQAAHWPLDETTGPTAFDSWGSYNGIITGANLNQPGKINKSFFFDGVDDYITVNDPGATGFGFFGGFSIFTWINTTIKNNGRILEKRIDAGPNIMGYTMGINNDGHFFAEVEPYDSDNITIEGTEDIANGEWHHVGMVRYGDTLEAYVDGDLIGTSEGAAGEITGFMPFPLRIGTSYDNNYDFTGYIDDIRFYDIALGPDNIYLESQNAWDNGYPSGGNFWSDYDGVDFNSTPSQDVPPPDGIGDTPYGFNGGQDNYPLMMPADYEIMNYDIALLEGWNLISVPLILPDESINEVLESIDGKWDYIQVYNAIDSDHWKTNDTFKPDQLNDLKTLNHKMGFWINVTEPNVNLTVHGYESEMASILLYAGWNLVGYPTLNDTMTVANALWGTGADRVEKFDALVPYRIIEVGPTYVMKPGEGYWIHVPADTIWVINW